MFDQVRVIGAGRAGLAIAGRLRERGMLAGDAPASDQDGTLVLLCVPDDRIAAVAAGIVTGPWVAHVSGATPLAALGRHARRFSVHPLQTFVRARGPEQLDGAWAAVTAEDDEARARGSWLAHALGLRPFDLRDGDRALYHAGAVFASTFLVTLYRAASSLYADLGVPPEALVPLIQRTIDNGFQATGPIVRNDRGTIERHVRALEAHRPDLLLLYQALADATRP